MRSLSIALLVLAIAGCRSKTERYGEVVAVTGEVTVVRGEADPEPLELGDRVRGSDRVRTGEAAEVRIKLAHNGVVLVYGGGVDVLLSSASGWSATGDVSAGVLDRDPDDKTNVAGRHGEKEAGTDPNAVLPDVATASEASGAEADDDHEDRGVGGKREIGGGSPGDGMAALDDAPPRAPRIAVEGGTAPVRDAVRDSLRGSLEGIERCLGDGGRARLVLALAGGRLVILSVEGGDAGSRSCLTGVLRDIKLSGDLPATKNLRTSIEL